MIGVSLCRLRSPETNAGWSPANEVQNAITFADRWLLTRETTLLIVLSPWVKLSCDRIFPPSCWYRTENALQTSLKYRKRLSVTTTADVQCFCLKTYCAIAAPSSCAALPKLNASLPFDPKRSGLISSVPMHGAIVSFFAFSPA